MKNFPRSPLSCQNLGDRITNTCSLVHFKSSGFPPQSRLIPGVVWGSNMQQNSWVVLSNSESDWILNCSSTDCISPGGFTDRVCSFFVWFPSNRKRIPLLHNARGTESHRREMYQGQGQFHGHKIVSVLQCNNQVVFRQTWKSKKERWLYNMLALQPWASPSTSPYLRFH